jgi:hypothetical protein
MNRKPRLRRGRPAPSKRLSEADHADGCWTQLRHGLDPVLFAREALVVKTPNGRKFPFEPDEKQQHALRCRKKRIVLLWARQRGKSDIVALRALHRALFWAGSMILIVSASEDQAIEVMKKVNAHRRKLEISGKALEDNKSSIELPNRSRIVALPASVGTIRGYSSVDLLIEDEAAEVPDDLHETVKPMLQVSDGTMFLMGTPKGPKGHFSDIWHHGGDEWEKSRSTAWENPRVRKAQLEREKLHCERMGKALWFQQEYECAFIATGAGLVYPFNQAVNSSPAIRIDNGWQFAMGIDYGFTESTAFVVLGWQRHDPVVYVVESFKREKLSPSEAAEVAHKLTQKYPFARIVGDVGGLGKGYVEEARRRFRLPIEPAQKNNKRGYIDLFVGDLKTGLVKTMPGNDDLVKEWNTLPWDEGREEPEEGYEDHLADACLYAWRATYSYLESARVQGPAPGTPEALAAEAEAMLERRITETSRQPTDWWDSHNDGDDLWPSLN